MKQFHEQYRRWYYDEYVPALRVVSRIRVDDGPRFRSFAEWLIEYHGATTPGEDLLEEFYEE